MKRHAFVLMPLAAEFDQIYEYLIRAPLEEAGYEVRRADDILSQQNILQDIVQAITASELVVADLSTSNPNVYYELGLAHAFRRPVILLAQDIEEVPFDLRSYRIVKYSTHFSKMNEARAEMEKIVHGAREGTLHFGSPVSDFGGRTEITPSHPSIGMSGPASGEDDDRGLLDYQTELLDSMQSISQIVTEIGERLARMTPDVRNAIERITDREAGAPKKQRETMRSLSALLDDYASWLEKANRQYREALGNMDGCLTAMFSGEFQVEQEGMGEVAEFVRTLEQAEKEIKKGRNGFLDLVSTIDSLPRIEKDFNRARRKLSSELKNLVDNVDQTISVLARARNAAAKFVPEGTSQAEK